MASPRTHTRAWSAMDMGFVKKKKARVMWKREMEVKMVFADMSAMVAGERRVLDYSDAATAGGQVWRKRSGTMGGSWYKVLQRPNQVNIVAGRCLDSTGKHEMP
jgi:hypothetical protein